MPSDLPRISHLSYLLLSKHSQSLACLSHLFFIFLNPLYHTISHTFSHTLTHSHNTLTHCQTLGPPFSPFFAFFSCVFLFIWLSSSSASDIDWSHSISHLQPSIFIVQPIFLILLSSKLLAASNIRGRSAAGVGCRGPTRRNMRPEI